MSNLRCQDQQVCSLSLFQWYQKGIEPFESKIGQINHENKFMSSSKLSKGGILKGLFLLCFQNTTHDYLNRKKKWKFVQKRIVWWSKTDSELMIARKFFLKKKSRYSNFVLRFISLCVSLLGLIKCLLSSSISRI